MVLLWFRVNEEIDLLFVLVLAVYHSTHVVLDLLSTVRVAIFVLDDVSHGRFLVLFLILLLSCLTIIVVLFWWQMEQVVLVLL